MSPITDKPLMLGPDSVPVDPPDGVQAMVVLDWRDGKVVGLEILDASKLLHDDLPRKRNGRLST